MNKWHISLLRHTNFLEDFPPRLKTMMSRQKSISCKKQQYFQNFVLNYHCLYHAINFFLDCLNFVSKAFFPELESLHSWNIPKKTCRNYYFDPDNKTLTPCACPSYHTSSLRWEEYEKEVRVKRIQISGENSRSKKKQKPVL